MSCPTTSDAPWSVPVTTRAEAGQGKRPVDRQARRAVSARGEAC